MYQVIVIAIPPPVGIGWSCKLQVLGIANKLLFSEYLIINRDSTQEAVPSPRIRVINNKKVKVFLSENGSSFLYYPLDFDLM